MTLHSCGYEQYSWVLGTPLYSPGHHAVHCWSCKGTHCCAPLQVDFRSMRAMYYILNMNTPYAALPSTVQTGSLGLFRASAPGSSSSHTKNHQRVFLFLFWLVLMHAA
jgi:hypothetical protein